MAQVTKSAMIQNSCIPKEVMTTFRKFRDIHGNFAHSESGIVANFGVLSDMKDSTQGWPYRFIDAMDLMFNILLSMAKDGSSDCPQFTTPGRSSRDNLINTVYKLHRTRLRILEPYRKLKNALKQLQEDYLKVKEANPIMRYMKLQQSVREVVIMEKQYWKLLDIPPQDGAEESNDYVVRIIHLLEETSSAPPSGGIGALLSSTMMGRNVETRVDQSLYDSIKSRKTEELQKDCENMYVQLYKLIRKYQGLRRIIKELHDKYDASRKYPIVPRYPLLKKMIKSALRAPEFADICHEQTE